MLHFSANIQNVIASGKSQEFYLLNLKNGDGSLYRAATSHYNSITMGDGITYVADDYIYSVDLPQISADVDREQFKLVLTDPTFMNGVDAERGLIGKKMQLILGFLNPDTGAPYTAMVDTFTIYKGKIDSSGFNIKMEEIGESLFAISGASPMASLEMSRSGLLSRDNVRSRHPTDSCADMIYEGSGGVAIKWGEDLMPFPLLIAAIAAFVIAAASAAYSVVQAQKMKERAARAADLRKGLELPTEGSAEPIALVYGRAKIGGVRVFHATSSNYAFVSSNADKSYLTGAPAASGYTASGSTYSPTVSDETNTDVSNYIVNAYAGGYMSQSLNGDRNDFLFFQQAMCVGPINAVRDIIFDEARYLNDQSLGSYGEIADPDGDTHNGIKAALRVDYHYGNSPVANTIMSQNFPERNTAVFAGMAYLNAFVRLDRDNPQFNGIPVIQSLIEGRKVYTWSGGVKGGSRVYTNNPPWCLLDYLLDTEFGKGVDITEIDIPSFQTAAAVCATIVQSNVAVGGKFWKPTGTAGSLTRNIPLYECNVMLDPTKPIRENVETLLATMGDARLIWSNGTYKLSIQYPLTNDAIVLDETIDDDDLTDGQEISINWPTAQTRLNFCTVKFHNEHESFKEDTVSWPPKQTATYTIGIGAMRYALSNKTSWDEDESGARLLNRYAVWDGSGNSCTLTYLFRCKKEYAGTYSFKVAGDSYASGQIKTYPGGTVLYSSGTGDIDDEAVVSVSLGNASFDVVYQIVITANNVSGFNKGAAAVIENSSRVLWTTRDATYDSFQTISTSSYVYDTYKAEDGGMELESVVFADGITDPYHAMAKAEELVRTSRSAFTIKYKRIIKDGINEPGDFVKLVSNQLAIGVVTPLYLRVDDSKVVDSMNAEVTASRFDASQLAWAVKDDQPGMAPPIYDTGIPRPQFIAYLDVLDAFAPSSGKLVCTNVGFEGFTGFIWYVHKFGIDPVNELGAPIYTEIGRSSINSFILPVIPASSAFFGVRCMTSSGAQSDMTITDREHAVDLSHSWGRYASIDASDYTFVKDGTGTLTPASITLTANVEGFTTPAYQWFIDDVLQGTTTNTLNVPAFSDVSAKRIQVRVHDGTDLSKVNSDTIILYYMPGGVDAYVGYLTNESQILPASSTGVVSSYAAATGTFMVVSGSVDISAYFAFSVATGGNPQGLTVGWSGANSNVYSVSAGFDAAEPVANVLLRAEGGGPYTGIILEKNFSLGKSLTGINFSLTSDGQTVKYDSTGTLIPSQTITFTGQKTNTTQPMIVELFRLPGLQAINANTYLGYSGTKTPSGNQFSQTGLTVTLTGANFDTATQTGDTGLLVKVTCDGLIDQISVVQVQDGLNGAPGPTGPPGPTISLTVDDTSFHFIDGATENSGQVITVTATINGPSETINWSSSPTVTLGAPDNLHRTLSIANFGTLTSVGITATGATSGATSTIYLYRDDKSSGDDTLVPDPDFSSVGDSGDTLNPWIALNGLGGTAALP